MPAEEITPAIVLRARDYSESDRVVTLLTRDFGKLGGMAKGAKASRRRFERKLDPFTHVMVHFRRRPHGALVFITRAEAADLARFEVEGDVGKYALGCYVLELADAFTSEHADAAGAYRVVAAALSALAGNGANRALRQSYELSLLAWAGFGLELARCRVCASETASNGDAVYFVVSRGGVVCGRCRGAVPEGAIKMSARSAIALARLAATAFDDALGAEPAGPDAALALSRFISSVLDRKLRTLEFLELVSSGGASL
ncbi:MAG: DNA repair protein RecO [Candidatus Binataceae bacterium]